MRRCSTSSSSAVIRRGTFAALMPSLAASSRAWTGFFASASMRNTSPRGGIRLAMRGLLAWVFSRFGDLVGLFAEFTLEAQRAPSAGSVWSAARGHPGASGLCGTVRRLHELPAHVLRRGFWLRGGALQWLRLHRFVRLARPAAHLWDAGFCAAAGRGSDS